MINQFALFFFKKILNYWFDLPSFLTTNTYSMKIMNKLNIQLEANVELPTFGCKSFFEYVFQLLEILIIQTNHEIYCHVCEQISVKTAYMREQKNKCIAG